ncbi:MAG: acyl-CoA synthetase [Candidatus Binatia bacterium]|nr:MAG: acyl-CoA synthetase [Candidatus Binatia bacterium]
MPTQTTYSLPPPAETVAQALRARRDEAPDRPFVRFEERTWSYEQSLREASRFANFFLSVRDEKRPFHVGVLMDNLPEFLFAEFGCALSGGVLVGLNPTRTGEHLGRDIEYSDCQIVLVEERYAPQLAEALRYLAGPAPRVWSVDGESVFPRLDLGSSSDRDPAIRVRPEDLLLVIFTSGTTKNPKGVLNSHRRLVLLGWGAASVMCGFRPEDTVYCAMPLYHSNAQILAVFAALAAGGTIALARRFSKSRFLDDVRRYGATLFNYVGTPLAYILETPERPDDAENPLRLAYGNEAPRQAIAAFERRFGCRVVDGYGSSEVGVGFTRSPDDPPGSLGRAEGVKILDEEGRECPPARFDEQGRLLNPEEAIGEIVNTNGVFLFEGYYKDEASTRERTRGGWYHTGDLGYRDEKGYIYFAGRDVEWLRVGGENFTARPVEEALARHPDVLLASVYGVPDPEAGDQVMAAIQLRDGARFDPRAFAEFVDGPSGLPRRWRPVFVRIVREFPVTHTHKVLKRALQREKFLLDRVRDPVYWRPGGEPAYRPFTEEDLRALRERFERAGHLARLED